MGKSIGNGNGNGARKFSKVEVGGEIVKFEAIGDTLEGTYEGAREVTRDDDSQATIYDVRGDSGKLFSVWGTSYLNPRMEKVTKGDYIRISYIRDEPPKRKGHSPMKVIEVEVAIADVR